MAISVVEKGCITFIRRDGVQFKLWTAHPDKPRQLIVEIAYKDEEHTHDFFPAEESANIEPEQLLARLATFLGYHLIPIGTTIQNEDELRAAVIPMIRQGNWVQAIKLARQISGWSLRQCKRFVYSLRAEYEAGYWIDFKGTRCTCGSKTCEGLCKL